MSSLLDNPAFPKRVLPLSVDAWHKLIVSNLAPQRAELIRGVIVEKVSKSILHVQSTGELFALLFNAIGKQYWVRQHDPITTADSEPEPDISVVTGGARDYQNHPTTAKLVVEVAVTTLAEDREMAVIFAEAGVEEYWIINASDRSIEVHPEPSSGVYGMVQTVALGETLVSRSLPGVEVVVQALFEGLKVEA